MADAVPSTAGHPSAPAGGLRRDLRRKLIVLLVAKGIGLFALWALFFSPSHRMEVTAPLAERQLALDAKAEKQ